LNVILIDTLTATAVPALIPGLNVHCYSSSVFTDDLRESTRGYFAGKRRRLIRVIRADSVEILSAASLLFPRERHIDWREHV
jgi:hypothetical protein